MFNSTISPELNTDVMNVAMLHKYNSSEAVALTCNFLIQSKLVIYYLCASAVLLATISDWFIDFIKILCFGNYRHEAPAPCCVINYWTLSKLNFQFFLIKYVTMLLHYGSVPLDFFNRICWIYYYYYHLYYYIRYFNC